MDSSKNKKNSEIDIDLSYLSDVASGSTEFMVDMINIFLEQTPDYITQLGEAIKNKDWPAVANIAHKIKPTLAFMGVASARDDMGEIEENARSLKKLEEIAPKYHQLESICGFLFTRLKEVKKELEAKL
jgi:HPt (histidine-containing phosphotransfer) domain-containing protein